MKLNKTQGDEMPESEEQELLNIYSVLLTAKLFLSSFCSQELLEKVCNTPIKDVAHQKTRLISSLQHHCGTPQDRPGI